MKIPIVSTLLVAAASACAASSADPARSDPVRIDSGRRIRIVDPAGEELSFDALLDRLAQAEAVFLGETHQDETTHRFERDVYAGLIERTNGRVILALEMFSRDVQPELDRYVHGALDEEAFLETSRPWGNYRTGYRPMIELAREHGLPVVASNVPADLRRKVSRGRAEAFEELSEEERGWIAPELLPNSDAYWERFARVVRGHMDVSQGAEGLLYSGQSQWDNTMGFSCAAALEAHPGFVVLHVNGGFHSAYHDGTVAQLLARRPGTRVATVAIEPTNDLLDPESLRGPVREPVLADFVVLADGRARGPQSGVHAVRSARELRYSVHLPSGVEDEEPVPLLIWLGGDGLSAADSLAYWELALEGEAAVAAVELPYPQLEDDLTLGGRWFWSETYHEDLGCLVEALDGVRRYVVENYPVDPGRIVLAGEGTGATVAAKHAFSGVASDVPAIASGPRRYRRLREWPLPDEVGVPGLTVLVTGDEAREWWTEELAAYEDVGLVGHLEEASGALRELERRVRAELGLAALPATAADTGQAAASPKARLWSQVNVRARERGDEVPTVAELPARLASGEANGLALPPASGLFGGTTIVVLPAGATPEERSSWLAVEESDAMVAHGRFFGLRVALSDAEPRLVDVLAELEAAGRSNVLVVPAVFCADAEVMRGLRDEASGFQDRMELTFSPGLGGRLHLASVPGAD